jgi:hypothetical protein
VMRSQAFADTPPKVMRLPSVCFVFVIEYRQRGNVFADCRGKLRGYLPSNSCTKSPQHYDTNTSHRCSPTHRLPAHLCA